MDWSPAKDLFCTLDGKTKSYCTPERYPGRSSRLYRNLGDGRFEDVTKKAGLENANQKALGVAPWDFDGDGRVDLFVANDTAPNNLFRNKGDGTFEDVGDPDGRRRGRGGPRARRDGRGVGRHEERQGRGASRSATSRTSSSPSTGRSRARCSSTNRPRSGVGPTSFLDLTFGVLFFDADLDGRMDLLLANGHVEPTRAGSAEGRRLPAGAGPLPNAGDGRFTRLGERSGDLAKPLVGRGAAYADLDGDGDLDVILVENGGPARVFLNPTNAPQKSVRLRLTGAGKSNRDAVGARVTATIGPRTLTQQVSGGQSYLSASEKTLTFGLGAAAKIDTLEIRWPDGTTQTLRDVPGGARLAITQGAGPS